MSGGFSNPVVQGNGALIRTAIKSPNYIPGVQGWSINRDGSSEFSSGQFRGAVLVGVAPNPRVEITNVIPAPLVAASADFTWSTVVLRYWDATTFTFDAQGFLNTGPYPIQASGSYDSTNGVLFHQFLTGPGSGSITDLKYGSDVYNAHSLAWDYRHGAFSFSDTVPVTMINDTPSGPQPFRMGRGLIAVNYYTGGTGATSVGATEKALPAWTGADEIRFVNDHLYSIHCIGGVFSSVAAATELASIKIRADVNSTVAQILGEHRVPVVAGAQVSTFDFMRYVQNFQGVDIDKVSLGLTIARQNGTGNHSIFGNATNFPLQIEVKDEGVWFDTEISNSAVGIV